MALGWDSLTVGKGAAATWATMAAARTARIEGECMMFLVGMLDTFAEVWGRGREEIRFRHAERLARALYIPLVIIGGQLY